MVNKKGARRFASYVLIGGSTLLLDLGMLYLAVSKLGVPYYTATPISFLIAVSCNYILSRTLVFRESEREWHVGYAYFAGIAIVGAVVTTALVALLVSYLHLYFLLARVITAALVGIGNYLINLHFNFKVAGKHH